ncbi:Cupredoxin [Glomus cerebriforme]|uniref:Cupredoxin n=1 Tax=Glomus cerebriforme TaxID=658196 RepID=A0A397TRS6_9GLOM|nr:Cupredoxin [Glomus cerebriforme]
MIKLILSVILITFLFTFVNSENWMVQVGNAGKTVFIPDNFDANAGDTVTFNFVDGTHDVAQADEFGKCIKSALPDAFNSPINTGNAAAPPTAVWTLGNAGPVNYFCTIHCVDGMFAKINVLAAGAPLNAPGVKAAAPPATPPAQPSAPADDLPNVQPPKTPSTQSSASASTSVPVSTETSNNNKSSAARTDKQISVSVVFGALILLIGYFL